MKSDTLTSIVTLCAYAQQSYAFGRVSLCAYVQCMYIYIYIYIYICITVRGCIKGADTRVYYLFINAGS